MDTGEEKRVLAIFEHPLQEIEAVGGIMSQFMQEDVRVILLSPSCGEKRIDCEEAWWTCEKKLAAVSEKLGFEVIALSYQHDEWVKENDYKLVEYIGSMLNLVEPQLVLTSDLPDRQASQVKVEIAEVVTKAYNQFYNKGILMYAHSQCIDLEEN